MLRSRLAVAAGVLLLSLGSLVLVLRRGASPSVLAISTRGTVVVVRTAADSRVYLAYGPTAAYGLFTATSAAGRVHRFDLAPLGPGRYRVEAVAHEGGRTPSAQAAVTAPAAPTRHSLRIVGDHLELDGRPWIPRFAWGSCAAGYATEAAAGIDAFVSSGCGDSPQRQAEAAAPVGAVVVPAVDQADPALPTTVAAYLWDEPDVTHVAPARLAARLAAHPTAHGLPVLETFSRLAADRTTAAAIPYGAYARLANCLGIDVYPIYNTGDPSRIGDVGTAQQALEQVAAGKPTFQWIEAVGPPGSPAWTPTPAEVEAEAWLALVSGARGIGWWTVGASPFAVDAGNLEAIRAVDGALEALAPAIDAPRTAVTTANAGVDVLGTTRNGSLAVFAVNPSPSASVAEVFTLPGLAGRRVEVWGTTRTLRATGDAFADTLPPLAWRVYLVPPA